MKEKSLSRERGKIKFEILDKTQDLENVEKDALICGIDKSAKHCILLKIVDRIHNHQREISKNSQMKKENPSMEIRDLGFTKPIVLITTSTRDAAFELVSDLLEISKNENSQLEIQNQKRFLKEYAPFNLDQAQVEEKNDDDCFKMGIKFSKTRVKLYSDFYSCDLIIGSPLGLRISCKKENYDFLSGIEIMMVDCAHQLLMQNWEHTLNIFSNLNLIPKVDHGVDFSRVKEYILDGRAKYYRQNFILTDYVTPELVNLLNNYCFNLKGIH
jgi:U3 small nucleolar RNA-associated protein 25